MKAETLVDAAVAVTILAVLGAVAFDYAHGQRAEIARLTHETDSLRANIRREIDTVTVYVAKADRAKARSDSSKQDSDSLDRHVGVIDSTTLGVHLAPLAPIVRVPVPAIVVSDILGLRKTVADQAVTILDTRAALGKATTALGDAGTALSADSVLIRKLAARQCDKKCRALWLLAGLAVGRLAR